MDETEFRQAAKRYETALRIAEGSSEVALHAHQLAEGRVARAAFLEEGGRTGKSVAMLRVGGKTVSNGFLVTNSMLMTTHESLPDADSAYAARAQFYFGHGSDSAEFMLTPRRVFLSDRDLGFTIVGVNTKSTMGRSRPQFREKPLRNSAEPPTIGTRLNVIQYADQLGPQVAIHQARVLGSGKSFVHYDLGLAVQPGAPILDDEWQFIAMHRTAIPRTDRAGNSLTKGGELVEAAPFVVVGGGEATACGAMIERLAAEHGAQHKAIQSALFEPAKKLDYTDSAGYTASSPKIQSEVLLKESLDELEKWDEDNRTVVWFGTNRKPVNESDLSFGFSNQRATKVTHGRCKVFIPESHKIGSIGAGWLMRLLRWKDDRLKLESTKGLPETVFWDEVHHVLDQATEDDRQALLYLHGYNNTFHDAALRTAQIAADLKVPGITTFFSWPSKGSVDGYIADGSSIDASEESIREFLDGLVERTGARTVHILAHSMGNRALLRTVERIAATVSDSTGARFGQIILAAPDVDGDVFRNLAAAYRGISQRTTLYVSPADKAVVLSRIINGAYRVGLSPPVTVIDGIDTIDVPGFNLFDMGHGYFADAWPVLSDIFTVIRHPTLPAAKRQRLELRHGDDGKPYWMMRQ